MSLKPAELSAFCRENGKPTSSSEKNMRKKYVIVDNLRATDWARI